MKRVLTMVGKRPPVKVPTPTIPQPFGDGIPVEVEWMTGPLDPDLPGRLGIRNHRMLDLDRFGIWGIGMVMDPTDLLFIEAHPAVKTLNYHPRN